MTFPLERERDRIDDHEPPPEIREAIVGWLKSDLLQSTYRWLWINIDKNKVIFTTDQKWCEKRVRACFWMRLDHIETAKPSGDSLRIEYADPRMFERLESFINCLLW